MSDIDLKFYGVIALGIFLLSSIVLCIAGAICLAIAYSAASKNGGRIIRQTASGYFVGGVPFLVLNLVFFGVLLNFIDSNANEINQSIDKIACYAWIPIQLILWVPSGLFFKAILKEKPSK